MKKIHLLKKPIIRNILSAIAIAFFGFILLNLTFLFDALYQGIVRWLIGFFIDLNPDSNLYWLPQVMHISFVILVGLISFFIFRLKINKIYKAIYMIVPFAVFYATIGMFFYKLPAVVYVICSLFLICVLYYFYRTKQPWIYYYSLILVSLVMLIMAFFGVEI